MAQSPANIDDKRARREEEHIRQHDPHGAQPAKSADQDEPRAWPSSDRQKQETTVSRVERGAPGAVAEDEVPASTTRSRSTDADTGQVELPALGYPYSEQALTEWFHQTYARVPSERELGVLMAAMAQRDGTPPREGPEPDPHGWETGQSAPPATRR